MPPVPIGDHAALGDGRTAALVDGDGTVDWLCLPDLDATPVLSRLLDEDAGGAFTLRPACAGTADRRYLPGTNVLETTWTVPGGRVRVTDALSGGPGRDSARRPPLLVRRVDGLEGHVGMRWTIAPRFGDGAAPPDVVRSDDHGLRVRGGGLTVRLTAPDLEWRDGRAAGDVVVAARETWVLTLGAGDAPMPRGDALAELAATVEAWTRWSDGLRYDGPWRDAVLRSALALRLLVHEPTGAMAAAATLGLPEQPGGERNYDYRYCWLRDSSFVVDAFGHLGDRSVSRAYLDWMTAAMAETTPVLQPVYRLDGGTRMPEHEALLRGHGGARPVRVGNRAATQRQLGSCGDVLQSCSLLLEHGGELPDALLPLLTAAVDHIAGHWREPDAGIWELVPDRQHTWSKMACWTALARAADLAEAGRLDGDAGRWRAEAERLREHVEREHWSPERGAYVAVAGEDGLDAAVLLGVLFGYPPDDQERWHRTLDALDAELGCGALLFRTTGLRDREQTFLPCAFWRAHALARLGRVDEARRALDALVAVANDVGLLSEEAGPDGTLWGNVPQALTHAAFINAAVLHHHQRSEVAA